MGLDMYAFRHKGERIDKKTNRQELEGTEREPILFADWRKHNRLQGFMQEKYDEQNPESLKKEWNEFNCVPLYLSRKDLDELEECIRSRTLPETSGFFFGNDSYTWEGEQDDMKATDLKFVADAKKYLNEGYEVFYECWW
jgi:hypothetical protein|tara:strand:- start:247 stop:666 length:420 start_codon:yes stop_codon:yes gene_type:complete